MAAEDGREANAAYYEIKSCSWATICISINQYGWQ